MVGGGFFFCDGYVIVDDLCNNDFEVFCILIEILVLFWFYDGDIDICSCKYVIILDMDGEVFEICFNVYIVDVIDLFFE